MSVYHIVIQQATPGPTPNGQARIDLREQLRQIQQDVQAAAQDAQTAQRAKAAADAKATTIQVGPGERQITIDEHGIRVGPRGVIAPVPPLVPGYTIDRGSMNNVIPPQAVELAFGFFIMCATMVIGWPLARAFGRRIERRADVAGIDPAFSGQLQRIEQAVDAMSIEIERISESQRFMARLQNGATERGAIPSAERR